MNKITIKSDFITTDVTSIKIIDNKVLAGIGCFLHVYDLQTGVCKIRREIFVGQKIHGFHVNGDELVIYGGRLFTIIPYSLIETVPIQLCTASDWILTVQQLEDSKLALALAHNVIALWNNRSSMFISEVTCEEKCILYCALLLGSTWSDLVVFGGTVFSQIVIWSPSKDPDKQDKPVWHRVKGHKGVIFSIAFDPENKRLLSSSDDRSVRIWTVSDTLDWQNTDIKECLMVYGHVARVWRVQPSCKGFISIGEDSLICQWSHEGKIVSKVNAHQGGNIWSMDVNNEVVVTGGGDGGIIAWPLGTSPPATPLPPLPWQADWVRRVGLTAEGKVVATTELGRLCVFDQDGSWQQAWQNEKYRCYALLELSPCRTKVALASLQGEITIMLNTPSGLTQVTTCQVTQGKILSLIWLNSELMITSSVGGIRSLCSLNSSDLQVVAKYQSGNKCKAISAATLMSGYLILGDQSGSVFVHQNNQDLTLLQKVPRQICVDGVTSLHCVGSQLAATGKDGRLHWFKINSEGQLYPLSSQLSRLGWLLGMRDSKFGTLALAVHREIFTVWSLEQQRTLLQVDCGGGHRSWDFAIQGGKMEFTFVREKFVHFVSSETTNLVKPLLRGALHSKLINSLLTLPSMVDNSPQFLVSAGDEGSVRLWRAEDGSQVAALQAHLSSVRALCCHVHKGHSYLFSAGGRAQLVAWEIDNVTSDLHIEELDNHMLCEAPLSKTPWADTHFRPRANPETRYMSLCVLNTNDEGITILAACSDTMLRTFYFNIETKKISVKLTLTFHSCCILRVTCCDKVAVSASCDGMLALWNIDDLLSESIAQNESTTGSSKSKVQNELEVSNKSTKKSKIELLNLCTKKLEPKWSNRVHQSGINCLTMYKLSPVLYLLLSGGDDNKLAVSQIQVDKDQVTMKTLWFSSQAHTTEITGVFFLSADMFISTSIDQRVILWRGRMDQWQQLAYKTSTVADIQGLVVWNLTSSSCKICVYGKGSEVMTISW